MAAASRSPDDSDMEMEDDISQVDVEGANHSAEDLNNQCDIKNNMPNVEDWLYPLHISDELTANKDILSEKESTADILGLDEQGLESNSNADVMAFRASVSKVTLAKHITVSTEQPFVTTLEKPNISGQLAEGVSPFRLLQDYASDDNSEKDVETCVENSSVPIDANLHADAGSSLENANSLCKTGKASVSLSSNMPCTVVSSEMVKDTVVSSITNGNEHFDSRHVYQVSVNSGSSLEIFQKENIKGGATVNCVKFSKEHRQEEEKVALGSSLHKVDKFGRLVRDGGSDSDSDSDDDLHYVERRRMGRTRSRSPSHSPPRRRRRRSRQRRWDKRSRSRSWSPRNRRSRSKSPRSYRSRSRSPRNRKSRSPRRGSRSRSPNFQRAGEFSGENKRRVKGQMPECFDFQRGRCYRGASCRYMHHVSGKNDGSRQQRSKQQFPEFPRGSRSIVHEEIKQEETGDHKLSEASGLEAKPFSNIFASRDGNTDQKRDSAGAGVLNQGSQLTEYPEVASDKSCLNADCLPKCSDNSSISNSSHQKTTYSPNRLPKSDALPNTLDFHNHPSHIPSPSFMNTQGVDNPHLMQQPTASSMESIPSYMLPSQPSFFVPQSISSLTSLPPLPSQDSSSTVNAGTIAPGVSSHLQQIQLPLKNDFGSLIVPRSYPTELPAFSQSNGFQQQTCLPIQERNRPFLHASLPVYNLPNQQFGAPNISRSDGIKQPSIQNVTGSNSFAQGNSNPYTMPISQQMLGNRIQMFPIESLPAGGLLNLPSNIHPSQQQQQQSTPCMQHPMGESIYNLTGKMNSTSKDTQDIKDTTSHQVAIGGPVSSSAPNSYASTLDQSINSKYSINAHRQEKDITYNSTPFSLSHATDGGRDYGKQQPASLTNSTRATGQIARSGGDQYDPLFDSIEPSPKLAIKFNYSQRLEMTGDSDVLLGCSGSNKPSDMEENNKRKDGGAVASEASADYEEFGETAEAEVGAVENGSPSNPVEVNLTTGEIEIDQIKSPGKSKERRESRSMKLFKVALADFVKEVLKPSWRQGNMSKEAFKTIVKKTVDKVSGAMKSHQMPKSRAKIDQYIESSQRKLTKLVMGYVDKYVKV